MVSSKQESDQGPKTAVGAHYQRRLERRNANPLEMTGKTVLITGSTRGIGLEFAEHYIKLGWNVIGAARDLNRADEVQCRVDHH